MSQEIDTFDSQGFDLARFLGIQVVGESATQALVNYDHEEAVRKVCQGYVDLLNNYGTTSGKVVEERQWPNPRKISMFKITSKRECPSYERPLVDSSSVTITLESSEHTKIESKPYGPKTLTQIFPEDVISLKFFLYKRLPHRIIFQNIDFYIRAGQVQCWRNTADSDNILPVSVMLKEIQSRKRNKDATPEELEMLLTLRPLLEAYYQSIKPALPSPKEAVVEPKPRFRLPLPNLFRHS